MYRIRNIDNKYFFAEEISTGAIFPIYSLAGGKNTFSIRTLSYLEYGKYFVYAGVDADCNTLGSYYFDINDQKRNQKVPTIEEINKYLENANRIKRQIEKCESENKFICDRDIIKQVINSRKVKETLDFSAQYNTKISLRDIEGVGYDLSTRKDLCNVIGRDREIKELIKKTAIKKRSVMLLGEAGNGKTAIVETLALLIRKGTNKWLKEKTIISVNASSIVSGTKFRGTFEEKLNKLIDLSRNNNGNVILFIDEIHMLKGLGSTEGDEQSNAINILKPFLENRDIIVIGATTKKEFEILTEDEAFCGRFDEIEVGPLSKEMNKQILENYLKVLSSTYNVSFSFNELETSLVLDSILEVTDKKNQRVIGKAQVTNPRLSKNILEDAFVEAVYKGRSEVVFSDIVEAILDCDKISPTMRKEMAISLAEKLESISSFESVSKEKGLVLNFPGGVNN